MAPGAPVPQPHSLPPRGVRRSAHGRAWPRGLPEVTQPVTGRGRGLRPSNAKVLSAFWGFGGGCHL